MIDKIENISDVVWDIKYRYRRDGRIIDQTIEDTWRRVAKAAAMAETASERSVWQRAFYHILEDYKFLPGGRIIAGAGTHHHVTLFNCFVMKLEEDSLKGIFHALQEGALTLQQGGGVGYDFSVLRPKGEMVKKTGGEASGPVSFMRIWDTTCKILLSSGARRGAMMAVLRCDHPDIEEFISAKQDPGELRHFNVSVLITDAFMHAVDKDSEWPLMFGGKVYRRVRARDLWSKIIRSAYDYAEPGVLFGDTINRLNNLWYREKICATNPCGEIPLPPYGACNLGSINLTKFVRAPFTAHASLDVGEIEEVVRVAARFLDNVIDISRYPLRAQRDQAQGTRRIGLGVTGLADMFVMLGIHYGDPAAVVLARDLMKKIAEATWDASIELAREKDVFAFYQPDYLRGEFVTHLDAALQQKLARYGVRNSHHNTIAPTGTISLLAENVSTGIEPIFMAEYDRHVRTHEKEPQVFHVKDYAYQQWRKLNPGDTYPPAWVDTANLSADAHLAIQGVMQPFIDNAISKTINIPADYPFEKLSNIYTQAYKMGLKGCTIFRPNPVTGCVLEVPEEHCCQYEGELSNK